MQAISLPSSSSSRQFAVITAVCTVLYGGLVLFSAEARADDAGMPGLYPVGMQQMEYVDPSDGRHLNFALFYPAAPQDNSTLPYHMMFFTNLDLHVNAP